MAVLSLARSRARQPHSDKSEHIGDQYLENEICKQHEIRAQMLGPEADMLCSVTVLNRTKQVLESRAEDLGDFMKDLEKKQGVAGHTDIEDKIQGVSNMKEILDNQKDQTLQEITETVR